jgi:hypothetical protein
VLYESGTGTIWILKNTDGTFIPVYREGSPGRGIGGYDLLSPADSVFAFDYKGTGRLDHLVLYRPGTGAIWILKNQGGAFTPVYQQGEGGIGIGGYDLASPSDQMFAFDFKRSGKLDHLALYRPGTGQFWVLDNQDGRFSPVSLDGQFDTVFPSENSVQVIDGLNLTSPADRAFAFDYDSSGRLDCLVLYRPGTGGVSILRNCSDIPGDPGDEPGYINPPITPSPHIKFNGGLVLATLAPSQISKIEGQYPGDYGYRVLVSDVPTLGSVFADYPETPQASPLILLENGVPFGVGHSSHADIEALGQGRYSHWRHTELRFSTPDNSDPRANGRTYAIAAPTMVPLAYVPIEHIIKVEGAYGGSFGYRVNPSGIFSIISYLPADGMNMPPNNSLLILLENGVPVGPAHSLHAEIQQLGMGRYSHWHDGTSVYLWFSTSDNSDPRMNGRQYSIAVA